MQLGWVWLQQLLDSQLVNACSAAAAPGLQGTVQDGCKHRMQTQSLILQTEAGVYLRFKSFLCNYVPFFLCNISQESLEKTKLAELLCPLHEKGKEKLH